MPKELFDVSREIRAKVEPVAFQMGRDPNAIYWALSVFTAEECVLQKHLESEKIAWRLHDQALWLFRKRAKEQLEEWGISSTRDMGVLLFELSKFDLMSWEESDSVDDFADLFDFENEFRRFKHARHSIFSRWSLSTMFIVTTLLAVAVAIINRVGFRGLAPLLLSSWIATIGLVWLLSGVKAKEKERWWLLGVGFVMFYVGALLVAVCLYRANRFVSFFEDH